MKKLIVSKAVKEKIPQDLIKEIYRLIVALPTTEIVHQFILFSDSKGTTLTHTVPLSNFNYSLYFSKKFNLNNSFSIISYEKSDKIMIALTYEIK